MNMNDKILQFNAQKPSKSNFELLTKLKILNENKRIKIRAKFIPTRNKRNRHSLFMDFSQNGNRTKQSLRLYLDFEMNSKRSDSETFKKALLLRDHHENQLLQTEHNFKMPNKLSSGDFVAYFKNISDIKGEKTYTNAYKHLFKFAKGGIPFNKINKEFCKQFKEYLLKTVSQNTSHSYYSRFKVVINTAIESEYLSSNPTTGVKISKLDVEKSFLSIDEIKILNETPCQNEQTKQAFLFGCFTGLRFSDIKKLSFADISGGYILHRQKKTRSVERMKLSDTALKIFQNQQSERGEEELVFDLFGHDYTLKQIKKWVKNSGITKRVGWHTARHTFATLALNSGIDLYTVSKLLGHKEIRATQVYAKLIDKTKDEAIDRLPTL